jgi:predicted ATPase
MIDSINVTNFKSIKKASAKLPSFGAIVGKNAAGKTNLIQAIQFVRDLAASETTTVAQRAISLIPNELFNFNEEKNEFGIDITVKLKDDRKYMLCLKIGLINGSIQPGILIVNEEILYKLGDANEKEEIYFRDRDNLKDKNNNSIQVAVAKNKLALATYETQETELVREEFVKTFIPDIEHINNRESIAVGSIGYDDESENLASIIVNLHRNSQENYDNFQTIVRKLLPHFSSIVEISSTRSSEVVPSPERESYLVVLEEKNLKQQLSMQSVSSGDLKTLVLIATSMKMENFSTLIIEEIENGIHPKRIIDLIEHLERIAMIKKMQILFTTHSPIVINRLSAHKVVLTERETDNGTQFTLLEEAEHIGKIKKYLQEGGSLTDFLYTGKY